MFAGHFAAAFLAAGTSRRAPSLPTLFVGAQLVDWAFFSFAIFGIERMRIEPGITAMNPLDLYFMPYTHSLLGTLAWGSLFAIYLVARNRDMVSAFIGFLVVLSHWLLDFLTHIPDLTFAGGEPKIGLGLWNLPWVAIPLELGLIVGSAVFYMRRTKGPVAPPLIFLALLLAMQAVNWLGPEPEAADAGFYATALVAFLVPTLVAAWVASTRWHKREVGLAVPSPRR